jgi:hypothetical protein
VYRININSIVVANLADPSPYRKVIQEKFKPVLVANGMRKSIYVFGL